MTTTALRLVIVDDVDPSIEYTGAWRAVSGLALDHVGNFGPTYRGTIHSLRGGSGSFAFRFNGTRVEIQGSNNAVITNGVADPALECFVDGTKVTPRNPFQFPENSWTFCEGKDLLSGTHVITLNITSKDAAFYLDRIHYAPAVDTTPVNQSRVVSPQDSAFVYDTAWAWGASVGMVSQAPGASFTLPYYGSSIDLWGNAPSELPRNLTTATYQIDDELPVTFNVPNGTIRDGAVSMNNQRYFTSPKRALANHTLTVKYIGGTGVSPLILSSFVVNHEVDADASAASNTATTTASNPSSTQNTNLSTAQSKAPPGTIVGAALGCLAALLIIVLTVWYFLRRRRRRPQIQPLEEEDHILPFTDGLPPGPTMYHPPPMTQMSRKGPPVFDTLTSSSNAFNPAASSSQRSLPLKHHPTPSQSTIAASGSSVSGPSSQPSQPSRAVQSRSVVHQDSGIRLNQVGAPIVEHPPVYTAG